tara:strand:- start:63 stop:344 length:282 start_codon:yes stop_codon:yes gene_type:complete
MIHFDSDLQNPVQDAIDVILDLKFRTTQTCKYPADYYRKNMITVLIERMINQKSVKEISKMLNLNSDTVRRYEYRVFHILNRDSKIRKYKTSK